MNYLIRLSLSKFNVSFQNEKRKKYKLATYVSKFSDVVLITIKVIKHFLVSSTKSTGTNSNSCFQVQAWKKPNVLPLWHKPSCFDEDKLVLFFIYANTILDPHFLWRERCVNLAFISTGYWFPPNDDRLFRCGSCCPHRCNVFALLQSSIKCVALSKICALVSAKIFYNLVFICFQMLQVIMAQSSTLCSLNWCSKQKIAAAALLLLCTAELISSHNPLFY
jgi:hypothetical protein